VLTAEGRHAEVGNTLDCPLCDRAELPDGVLLVRASPQWNERTMPPGLKRSHRIAGGTWGRIAVHSGSLRFAARTDPELNATVGPGSTQAIPPEVQHLVEPLDQVCFSIDFFTLPDHTAANGQTMAEERERGGDTPCWAHLLCPECGAVLDGGPLPESCSAAVDREARTPH
jgi:tellurite resistance-related uncharacterized protein